MEIENIRVLFFGTPLFASRVLEVIYKSGFNICGVITQTTKRAGRGNLSIPSQVKELADKYHLLVYQPVSLNEMITIAKHLNPDIIIVAAYGKLLPPDVVNLPKFGSLNVHGSLLPKYRGASPIPATILNGDHETGTTVMKMTEKLDAGPIISQAKIKIEASDTTESLYQKLAEVGAEEIVRVIPLYISGDIHLHEQNHNQATYCSIIKKGDGLINWHRSAIDIERTTRAFIPWPHAYTNWHGKILKILEAKVVKKILEPGYVIALDKTFYIGCGKDSLEIIKLQLEGKNEMTSKDFLNGYRDLDGTTLS
jgi:methionyl-tRNA formyltransferase